MNILYITYPLSALLMMALPIALGVYLTRRFKSNWRLFWSGAAVFVASQIGHIPFNNWLNSLISSKTMPIPEGDLRLPFLMLLFGLSAGLWEEMSRYVAYRWWVKDARTWRKGLLLGAGHGGIEAIIFGFLALMSFFQLVALRNQDLNLILTAEQIPVVQQQMEIYWNAAWPLSLLGFVERCFAMTLHLALSLLVLQGFKRNQTRWLWMAVAWHTLANAVALYVLQSWQAYAWAAYVTEGVIGLFALASLLIILKLRVPHEDGPEPLAEPPPPPAAPPSIPPEIQPVNENPDNLDRTRYQ